MDVMDITGRLSEWLLQPCVAAPLLLLVSLCTYLRIFHDWIIDEFYLTRGLLQYIKASKEEKASGLNCTSILLERHARNVPENVFLLFQDQKYTYSQTNSKANQIANGLLRLGISREHTASIFMKNKPEFPFLHFACLKIAVPLAFLNTNLRSKALLHCIKITSSQLLIVDSELVTAIDEIAEELRLEGVRILVYGQTESYESLTAVVDKCTTEQPDDSTRRVMTPGDICLYIFTSGTTGLPKAAKILYGMQMATFVYPYMSNITSDDVIYDPLPLYHRASSAFLNIALYKGTTFAFAPKFSASRHWEDCYRYKATVVHYIGESCRYLLTTPPSEFDKKHNVRLLIGNGLRKEIWEELQSRFNIPRIAEGYGSTEGNCFFFNMRNKTGSVGRKSPPFLSPLMNLIRVAPQVIFIKYDVENQELCRGADGMCMKVPRGTPGLLLSEITQLSKFEGYINSNETAKKIVRNVLKPGDAFYNTGDLMLWDKDYYVYFVDRIGDTFRWKGVNVSTLEVGSLIIELDLIQDCTVYGVPIPGMDGKCGMGAIVLRDGVQPTEDVLKSIYIQCEHYLPPYARPIFIRFMPKLHLTGTFKHQKYTLLKEGFDYSTVPEVYVHDIKAGTYIKLTSAVYEDIVSGEMRV